MLILHFSKTPLAGAPIRLVNALKEHTQHDIYLVDKDRWNLYDHDLIYSENFELIYDLA